MRKSFYGSLCHNGIHGGGVYLDDSGFLFRCQKLTIEEKYKNYRIKYPNIKSWEKSRAALIFPAVTITETSGKKIKVLVFNRRRFLRVLSDKK